MSSKWAVVLAGLLVAVGALTGLAQDRQPPDAPRPLDAGDSLWAEELTFMEIRDAIRHGTTTIIVGTGGAIYGARTIASAVDESLRQDRLMATLSRFFAICAVLVTCIGLYGIVAMGVEHRTREIGIRVALGAQRSSVLRAVLGESVGLAVVGSVAGVALAIAATRVLERVLFELSPTDPTTIILAVVFLLPVIGGATYLPARRATALDPAAALRHE